MSRVATAALLLAAAHAHTPSVLMVLTSHDELGDTGDKTGWYLPEAAHPYHVFQEAGYEITFASPKGGKAPMDPGSAKPYKKDKLCQDFLEDDDVSEMIDKTTPLEDVEPSDYDAVFLVGGYGTMWDFAGNKELESIVAKIWEDGGVVSGVCHGPVALVEVKLEGGESLVKDKKVACFTNEEEETMKHKEDVPETCEDQFKDAGATYTKGKPWSDHVAIDGKLITGQNPMSAKSTAEAVVKELEKEEEKEEETEEEEKFQVVSDGAFSFGSRSISGTVALAVGQLTLLVMLAAGAKALWVGLRRRSAVSAAAVHDEEAMEEMMEEELLE